VSARQFASDAETITVTNTAGMVTEGTMNRGVERRFDTGNRMRWSVFLGAKRGDPYRLLAVSDIRDRAVGLPRVLAK
jgi:hypothetical protein